MKKVVLRASLALLFCSCIEPAFGVDYLPAPSDPAASQATKNVYTYLATRRGAPENSTIEGQFLGMINQILYPGKRFYGYFDINQHQIDGKLPAMAGSRYDGEDKETDLYRLDADLCSRVNAKLIDVWNQAHPIIHITATPRNPWNQQLGRVPDNSNTQKIAKLLRAATGLTAAEKTIRNKFWADIDVIAGGLQELENLGIPVLFRPFAEFNMSNKYYFDKQPAGAFVSLWKEVYHYYVDDAFPGKGLHNLLFCWEVWALGRNDTSGVACFDPRYPGDDCVDIVAGAFYFKPDTLLEYFQDPVTGEFSFDHSDPHDGPVYQWLISKNRPFGAAQYGLNQDTNEPGDHALTLAFMDYAPDLAFAAYWNQYQAVERQDNASLFVAESRVATHDDLPGFIPATVTLGDLNSTYDGSPKPVTVTTAPVGLSCLVTYNGSSTPPTNAGSYAAVGTIVEPGYTGTSSGTQIVAKASASVTLGNLSQTYDGAARIASATTSPADLSVNFTYDGSSAAPTDAGSYAVVGTINDANYTGSASGTLVVSKAAATLTLGNLSQTYNGNACVASATTSPADLSVNFTYDGSSTAPTDAGSYAVVGTINDTNYTGSASGTLVVSKAAATVALGSLSQTYSGSPRVATATTSPAALSVSFTYDGSSTAPTDTGSYAVVGTINDANYTGSASGTLVVSKALADVTLDGLSQIYSGSPRAVTATTSPADLNVGFTYDGNSTAPTDAGAYAIVGTIDDPNYTGSASGTLVIAKATATVTLDGLNQSYDGSARVATATTSPAGLSVSLAYDGSETAPTNAGSYAVVGTVNDTNYTGSASGTLVVAKATATVTLGSLTHMYDGSPKSATATTSPADLSVSFTYNGNSAAPSAVGSYAVVGTINDTNYAGSASGTMVIITTVTFTSVSGHDGWVIEDAETSAKGGSAHDSMRNSSALRTGDSSQGNVDRQYKAFVSFDTTSIPDGATVTVVTLRLKQGVLTGQNPFLTHGSCYVDVAGSTGFGGDLALAKSDFESTTGVTTQVATMSDPGANGNWSTGTVTGTNLAEVNRTGHTQLRVYFATDDNDDRHDDYIGWYSGEAAAGSRPELIVTYY